MEDHCLPMMMFCCRHFNTHRDQGFDMTAGSIAVPTVIPLRSPIPGLPKSVIDSNVKIEVRTETSGADIFYTLNGTKPEPFQKFAYNCTMRYRGPFTLPAGKQTVKALALTGNGERQSGVVTKGFDVNYAPPPEVLPEDDDLGFQADLEHEKSKLRIERTKSDVLHHNSFSWTEISSGKPPLQIQSDSRKAPVGARFSEIRRSGAMAKQPCIQISNNDAIHNNKKYVERSLPEEYTTEAIQALQNLTVNNKRDFLNFVTTDSGEYPSDNQWLPKGYTPENYHPHQKMLHHSPCSGIEFSSNQLHKYIRTERPRELKSVASQTVGLFFPSQKKIDQMEKDFEEKLAFEKQMRDRRPMLTAVSPGKGFWRKQMEHICQHLKAYTHNNAEFRALIGEPKMGRMITCSLQEDGYELCLNLTFALRNKKDPFKGSHVGIATHQCSLSQHIEQESLAFGSDDEINSEENVTSRSRSSTTRRKRLSRGGSKNRHKHNISPLSSKILDHLSSEDSILCADIQQLIDEGADPNCVDKNGIPAIHLAAKNKHSDCILVLAQTGADVNAKGPSSMPSLSAVMMADVFMKFIGPMNVRKHCTCCVVIFDADTLKCVSKGNTALHEAVTLGLPGLQCIETLLSCGADQNVTNDRGETPYDMASKCGYDDLCKRFTAALGQSQLEKMVQP